MKQEELKKVLAEVDPLLANAVDSMISFIHAKGIDGVPSERQIEQVNTYFDSIVSRTGKDYEKWSEYRLYGHPAWLLLRHIPPSVRSFSFRADGVVGKR